MNIQDRTPPEWRKSCLYHPHPHLRTARINLILQCFLCCMMSKVGQFAVFLSLTLSLAINMFICWYLVCMHSFPLYVPGNRLKHPSECTILKVVLKIVSLGCVTRALTELLYLLRGCVALLLLHQVLLQDAECASQVLFLLRQARDEGRQLVVVTQDPVVEARHGAVHRVSRALQHTGGGGNRLLMTACVGAHM